MNINDHILIQDFLQDKLSGEERNEVLSRMEKDNDFREKVDFERQLHLNLNDDEWSISNHYHLQEVKEYEELIKNELTQKLKNTLNKVNIEYQKNQKKKNTFWLLYSGIAVIIVLIGITFFLPSKTSSEDIYAAYLNISDIPSLIDRGDNDQELLIKVQKLFESEEYSDALHIIHNNFSDPQKNKAAIYLYTGISQMELNQYAEAEKTFNKLINSKLIDAPKAKWYKALLFIKTNNITRAKKLLSQIATSSENYKYKEASEILDKLKNP